MKKLAAVIGVHFICLSALSGCKKTPVPDLPGDAAAFEMGTWIDHEHDDDAFGTIEYKGSEFLPGNRYGGKRHRRSGLY